MAPNLKAMPGASDEPVVRELRAAFELTVFATGSIAAAVSWMTLMPYRLRERLIAMRERFERAKAGEIEVAEEAGRVPRFGLDQRYLECFGARGQIFGDGRAADAAADHNDPRLGLASRGSRTRAPLRHVAPAKQPNCRRVQHVIAAAFPFARAAR